VLIVEDEYFLAYDLLQLLAQLGMKVTGPVPTLRDGMRIIETAAQIDCAVLDANLCDESVFAISTASRERDIPFLFVTGYGSAQIPVEHRNIPRLDKPVEPDAVIAAIKVVIDAAQAIGLIAFRRPAFPPWVTSRRAKCSSIKNAFALSPVVIG
jgi:DNA-binding response OmpR family regulator